MRLDNGTHQIDGQDENQAGADQLRQLLEFRENMVHFGTLCGKFHVNTANPAPVREGNMAMANRLQWPFAQDDSQPPDWQAHVGQTRGAISHGVTRIMALMAHLMPGRWYSIAFAGGKPARTSLLPALIAAGKGRVLAHRERADALVALGVDSPDGPQPPIRINANCHDVDKALLHEVWAEVSGNDLRVDPEHMTGQLVESATRNGAGDARIVHAPVTAKPGKVYTRLIANTDNGAFMQDWHVPVIGGHMPLAMVASRPENRRFTHQHSNVRLADPKLLFTPEERSQLQAFCVRMGLDLGSLDVLRDRVSGKLHLVDADPGKMGPVAALGPWEQWTALRVLARALRNFIVLGRAA